MLCCAVPGSEPVADEHASRRVLCRESVLSGRAAASRTAAVLATSRIGRNRCNAAAESLTSAQRPVIPRHNGVMHLNRAWIVVVLAVVGSVLVNAFTGGNYTFAATAVTIVAVLWAVRQQRRQGRGRNDELS